jgi:prepilin-type N-terminal cleavage/methylation domain-containing protein
MSQLSAAKPRKGFTLVELAVVIVIIGVLAAFGVPRFLVSVEKSKASEAFQYLAAVRSAQERYIAQQGVYATDPTTLDITQSTPTYFTVGTMTAVQATDGTSSWTLTLTRIASSSSYGAYTVTFTQNGFDSTNSTVSANINPMGSTSGQ